MVAATKATPIVFIGSGPVAAAALSLLAEAFTIEAVITKPRPAHHRGEYPVVDLAKQHGLNIIEAVSRRELSSIVTKTTFSSQVAILIDFGIIVNQDVIDHFPLGIINSHFSILPEWRGADPITFSILSGQDETGVTLMKVVEAMDEGPILAYDTMSLEPTITTPQLTDRLIHLSHQLITRELPGYLQNPQTQPQSVTGRKVSYSRKLTKGDGLLSWDKSALQLEREIRAYQPWPSSYFQLGDNTITVLSAIAADEPGMPGQLLKGPKSLSIGCKEGSLQIHELKPAGKKAMSVSAFMAGYGKILPDSIA